MPERPFGYGGMQDGRLMDMGEDGLCLVAGKTLYVHVCDMLFFKKEGDKAQFARVELSDGLNYALDGTPWVRYRQAEPWEVRRLEESGIKTPDEVDVQTWFMNLVGKLPEAK